VRYRWAVLAAGTIAAACGAALFVTGLPVLVPVLREEHDLSLGEIGVLLASAWAGSALTLLLWGLAADRFGERLALAAGLGICAVCLVGAAYAPSFMALVTLLALAGASGASVNSAGGRAVMHWFGAHERGLALGIRQTAIPIGGLVGALAVPPLAEAGGSRAAFLFLAGLCASGALIGALVLRPGEPGRTLDAGPVLRDARLWRISLASGLYVFAQVVVLGFAVVFLHDEHGLSNAAAALVVAASQVLGGVFRVAAGRWSDVVSARVGPLRRVGLAISASFVVVAALAGGPVALLVIALALAGGLSMAWNGLSFAAVAELAGARRSGAAIGLQQTVLSGVGVVAPLAFAATVSRTSWAFALVATAAFPLAGWLALAPLRRE